MALAEWRRGSVEGWRTRLFELDFIGYESCQSICTCLVPLHKGIRKEIHKFGYGVYLGNVKVCDLEALILLLSGQSCCND